MKLVGSLIKGETPLKIINYFILALKHSDRERYPPSNEHYQKRTTTHVRSNSVPNRRKQMAQASNSNNSQSAKASSKHRTEISDPMPSSNHIRKKSREPQIEDDYTKLIRIESQVDSYIKRHALLSNELDSVEQNLRQIEEEFNDEFDQLVLTSNQKHVLQTGDRVMKKLNATLNTKPRPQSEPTQRKKTSNKSSTLPGNGKRHVQSEHTKSQSKPTTPTEEPRSLPPLSTATNDLVHAQYAIIKTSTPNLDKPLEAAQFIPAENSHIYQQNHTALVEDYSGLDDTDWSFYQQQQLQQLQQPPPPPSQQHQQLTRVTSPKMYLNMAMTMHSDNPTVEHCFRKIELLRPRILGYKSEHRYRVYHELYNEIMALFYRLQNIDEQSKQQYENDINIALTELHNLSGVMERSIDCQNSQCDICNSFNYRAEIQV